jgi:hypothetical protein
VRGTEKTSTEQVFFAPKETKPFTEITISGKSCLLAVVKAAVKGSVAASVNPESTETKQGKLIFPSEQQKKIWQPENTPEETEPKLTFDNNEARFEAEYKVELTSGEAFGIFE